MQCTGSEWNERRHQAFVRLAEKWRREREAAHRFTANPEPPGDGWSTDIEAFAAAGVCELWRMDLGDKTAFFRHSDFPEGFNFSGMWWRKA